MLHSPAVEPQTQQSNPSPDEWDFFIAYAKADAAHAENLYRALRRAYKKTFLDSKSIRPGEDWGQVIPRALSSTRIIVVLVSAEIEKADYLREEIASAIQAARRDRVRRRVVPVFLDGLPAADRQPPYGLHSKQGLDGRALGTRKIAKELRALARYLTDQSTPSDPTPRREELLKQLGALTRDERDAVAFLLGSPVEQASPEILLASDGPFGLEQAIGRARRIRSRRFRRRLVVTALMFTVLGALFWLNERREDVRRKTQLEKPHSSSVEPSRLILSFPDPEGDFEMGRSPDAIRKMHWPKQPDWWIEKRDRQVLKHVVIRRFSLEETEVSCAQTAAWLNALSDSNDLYIEQDHDQAKHRFVYRRRDHVLLIDIDAQYSCLSVDEHVHFNVDKNRAMHPITMISRAGSAAYCDHYGRRLPTAAEWEFATRGGKAGRLFPWGDSLPTCQQAVFAREPADPDSDPQECSGDHPVDVDVYLGDMTPEGVKNLAGNVAEIVSDPFDPNDPTSVQFRGGNFLSAAQKGISSFPSRFPPIRIRSDETLQGVGFRCAQ